MDPSSTYKMASKQQDSSTSCASGSDSEFDTDTRSLWTRAVEKSVLKAKKTLSFSAQSVTERQTRTSTSAQHQRPITGPDDVSSSLSSVPYDSDQDKDFDPSKLSEDSSDKRLRLAERRELRSKKRQSGIASGKSCCFYNNNYFHYGKFCIL